MDGVKEPSYKINPNLRLTTRYLSVAWHCVDLLTLECESRIPMEGRQVYQSKMRVELLVQIHDGTVDIVYSGHTDFETKAIQKWLRVLLRDTILSVAQSVLPARVRYWEERLNLHGSGVTVKRLNKNILGQCSFTNHITLQPFLVIFKQEWMDGVILHEIAHYRHKHHRKAFWDYLSTLLGKDSHEADAKNDIALSPYYHYYLFLTK